MTIQQIKTYRVSCDESSWVGSEGYYQDCDSEVIVTGTDKTDADRNLPDGWRIRFSGDGYPAYVTCPKGHPQ